MHERSGVPLASYTTLRLGGPAARMVEVDRTVDLVDALRDADRRGRDARPSVLLLGGGSNLVVSDEGFEGSVLAVRTKGIEVDTRNAAEVVVTADAGVVWDELVARAVNAGWSGVECLSGIPGSVGATPMQNVGAYGQEVATTIRRVRVFDRITGEDTWIAGQDCAFGYRTSRFRGSSRHAILAVEFAFLRDPLSAAIRYAELSRALGVAEGDRAPLGEVRDTVIRLRRGKGMVLDDADANSVSAGSFFVNPVMTAAELRVLEGRAAPGDVVPRFAADEGRFKVAAAWLIERAGFVRGYRRGPVGISTKHSLALVNFGGATTRQLLDLAREVQSGVRARFGVELHAEPVMVGCSL